MRNYQYNNLAIEQFSNRKGVSLIIVVFAMMLFAVLGWTLAAMLSTDFEANLRNLDSERALGLAEAGENWALQQLVTNPNFFTATILSQQDTDCLDSTDWRTHSLSPGQYRACCRSATTTEGVDRVLELEGYISQVSGYRALRKIKLLVEIGSLTNALQTQVPDPTDPQQGLFNWYPARSGHGIGIEGNIEAGHYEGDGIYNPLDPDTYDQLGQDYDPPPPPLLPLDIFLPHNDLRNLYATHPFSYPSIDMDMLTFYNLTPATQRWPSPSTRQIQATANLIWLGGNQYLEVTTPAGFFTGMADQVVRRTSVSDWWQGDGQQGDSNWRVILGVTAGGTRARVYDPPPPPTSLQAITWPDEDPSTPGTQVNIRLVRRFSSAPSSGIWYIGGAIAGGTTADTLIDLRSNNITFRNTSLITEGDIAIKGLNRVQFRFTGGGIRYPNLATQDGNIISIEPLGTVPISESSRRLRRQFAGLIYSEFGLVNLNYLTGTLVYGNRITLDGQIYIRYQTNRISPIGFVFNPRVLSWQEQ